MSAVEKLERLLARVQSRRTQPRGRGSLAAVEAPLAGPPISTPRPPPAAASERRPSLPTPLEDAMGQLSPTPVPGRPPSTVPPAPADEPSVELSLDGFEERPAAGPSAPEPSIAKVVTPRSVTPVPPAVSRSTTPLPPEPASPAAPRTPPVSASVASAPVANAPAASTRGGPPAAPVAEHPEVLKAPAAKAASPVRLLTEAKPMAALTFAELLEQALSVRPRR